MLRTKTDRQQDALLVRAIFFSHRGGNFELENFPTNFSYENFPDLIFFFFFPRLEMFSPT